ncbi:MAG: PEGA domain-containing protein, partial [Butyrivibrio sp.]|nr:PEGA domain-containing protein [Butyrivibrio sp.]
YLRLRNEQALIGGWIEVGNTVIREISEDMLLVVPEGNYQVALVGGGVSSTKDVVIERDRETVLDVGDIEIVKDKTGRILFSVTPADAEVTIDGQPADISSPVELPYGIHQVHLEAEGYDSLTKYIQVGSEYAKLSFTLEEKKEDDSTVSGNDLEIKDPAQTTKPDTSVSENSIITPSQSNKVYIDAPKNVEVYLDSNYVGIAPVSFKKVIGSHTVTLRKSGYKTKSYTIYLYNDGEDITYSFADLEKETATVSGNSTSSSSKDTSKNPSGSSTGTTSGGNKGDPSGSSDSTETPPGGNKGDPSGSSDSTKNPPGGNGGNPSDGSTGTPPGGSEGNPSGSSGSTENPSGGNEGDPSGSSGSTENPSEGSTEGSSDSSSKNPSGGSTENPPSGDQSDAPRRPY